MSKLKVYSSKVFNLLSISYTSIKSLQINKTGDWEFHCSSIKQSIIASLPIPELEWIHFSKSIIKEVNQSFFLYKGKKDNFKEVRVARKGHCWNWAQWREALMEANTGENRGNCLWEVSGKAPGGCRTKDGLHWKERMLKAQRCQTRKP